MLLRVLIAAALLCSCSTVVAASKTEQAAAATVESVLRRELTDEVPNREVLLRETIGDSPRSTVARWAVGQIDFSGQWRQFAEHASSAADNDVLREYRDRRDSADLTPERHRELADWCHRVNLPDEERAHLWACLQANPADELLLRRLGYRLSNGHWLSGEEHKHFEKMQRERTRNLKRWDATAQNIVAKLTDSRESVRASGQEMLANIQDPSAVAAFEVRLCSHSAEVSRHFLQWLSALPPDERVLPTVVQALLSPWEETRLAAANYLRALRRDDVVAAIIPSVAITRFRFDPEDSIVLNNLGAYEQSLLRLRHNRFRVSETLLLHKSETEFQSSIVRKSTRILLTPRGIPTEIYGLRRDAHRWAYVSMRIEQDRQRMLNEALNANTAAAERSALADDYVKQLSRHACQTLNQVTGLGPQWVQEDWWTWWAQETNHEQVTNKQVVEVDELEEHHLTPQVGLMLSCLPAGTLVHTERGPKPIETIRLGDKVLAKTIESGELRYRVVLQTTVRQPQPLVKLSMASETIEATRGHHFWVSGKGWRMAREIQAGDRLHGVNGTVSITDVSTGDFAEVHNLVVDGAHTYFVGESLVLSHDVTFPLPTAVKVPGLALVKP